MPIPVVCPSCGNNISAPDHVAGRTLRCFKCLNPFTVPNVVPSPTPVAPVAQLSPSFEPSPAPVSAPPASFEAPATPPPVSPPSFELSPEEPAAPQLSAESAGPDPFELTEEQEHAFDAPPPAVSTQEELPSTQDLPLEEAAMELSPADEVEAPVEEAPQEEVEEAPPEEPEEPVGPRKSRIVAALLGIFFPYGFHRFYLGYVKTGILQLVLCPCFGIGILWAWLEGLLLLIGKGPRTDGRGVPLR